MSDRPGSRRKMADHAGGSGLVGRCVDEDEAASGADVIEPIGREGLGKADTNPRNVVHRQGVSSGLGLE